MFYSIGRLSLNLIIVYNSCVDFLLHWEPDPIARFSGCGVLKTVYWVSRSCYGCGAMYNLKTCIETVLIIKSIKSYKCSRD